MMNVEQSLHWSFLGSSLASWFKQGTKQGREQAESLSTEVHRCPLLPWPLLTRCAEPFEDEIHPRLRFAHRGLVAMANNGTKNTNDSQFFITLGPSYVC